MVGVRTWAGLGALLATATALSACGSTRAPAVATTPTPSAAAGGRTPWQQTAGYSAPKGSHSEPATISFAAGGSSALSWLLPGRARNVRSVVAGLDESAAQAGSSTWPKMLVGPAVINADETVTAIGYDLTSGGGAAHLRVAQFAVGGALTGSYALSAGSHAVGQSALATDAAGNMALVWVEFGRDRAKARVRVAFGTQTAGFGPSTTLQTGDPASAGHVAVAIGAGGDAVVAADSIDGAASGIAAWTFQGGQLLRGPLPVSDSTPSILRAAMTPKGRAFVAYGAQTGGRKATSPLTVGVATMAGRDADFGAPQVVDPGGAVRFPGAGFALAAGPDGRATLAWVAARGRGNQINVVVSSAATGAFGAPQQLPGQQIGGLAIRRDGLAVVTTGTPSTGSAAESAAGSGAASASASAWAFVRPAGAAGFGDAERVPMAARSMAAPAPAEHSGRIVPGQEQNDLAVPAPAFNPTTGRPSIAFVVARVKGKPGAVNIVSRDKP